MFLIFYLVFDWGFYDKRLNIEQSFNVFFSLFHQTLDIGLRFASEFSSDRLPLQNFGSFKELKTGYFFTYLYFFQNLRSVLLW